MYFDILYVILMEIKGWLNIQIYVQLAVYYHFTNRAMNYAVCERSQFVELCFVWRGEVGVLVYLYKNMYKLGVVACLLYFSVCRYAHLSRQCFTQKQYPLHPKHFLYDIV